MLFFLKWIVSLSKHGNSFQTQQIKVLSKNCVFLSFCGLEKGEDMSFRGEKVEVANSDQQHFIYKKKGRWGNRFKGKVEWWVIRVLNHWQHVRSLSVIKSCMNIFFKILLMNLFSTSSYFQIFQLMNLLEILLRWWV